LDVLQNYMTYKMYYKIAKIIEDNPEFDTTAGSKAIINYETLHPHNISQKTAIMLEHFMNVTRHKIGGRAKAMVVTPSRLHAVRYVQEFKRQIKEKGLNDLEVLVAFSGEVKDNDDVFTEEGMNKDKEGKTIKEKALPETFHADDYGILVVAEKYQTGFDEPLLHTMFVDKKLSGVKAVQTLSRLNRTTRGKVDTFVLDFVNSAEDIKASFEPFYEETVLLEETDPNVVYDMKNTLDDFRVYQKSEVDKFADIFYQNENQSAGDLGKLQGQLRPAIDRYEVLEVEKQDIFKGFIAHIDKLRSYLDAPEEIHLGRKPEDLLETLVNMVLGSPAICIYRSNGRSTARATSLAKVFVNNFNLPESTAIIDLAYGRCRDDNSHWQNVLKYCKDGCFQAMIDEYIHMLKETAGFQSDGNQYQIVHDMIMDSLKIHTATYIADTYPDFKKRINGADRKSDGCRIRSSYAVGFTKDAGDNSKVVMRKENIRNAFNSPMRPFVLATTSIGQEGLDFHNYCRVIMHWNLPSNPIDLEQREGRINRFKCLAIRQNVADKYGKADGITFKRDIWIEMFEAAKAEKQNDQSELVPFWCFGKNQSVKIERLVPMYPMSKDEVNYERLIKILSLYRLTLGQTRQEELLEYLFKEFKDISGLKKLFIDLSPFSKGKEG